MNKTSFPTELDALAPWLHGTLSRGVADPRSAFHWPTLATIDSQGHAQQRTMVLRAYDPKDPTATFFTDQRSAKVAELKATTVASLHVHDRRARIQVRLGGRISLHRSGPIWEEAWRRAQQGSLRDYQSHLPPGTPLSSSSPASAGAVEPQDTFGVLTLTFQTADVLHLGRQQHHRAKILFGVDGTTATWLMP